MKKYFPWLSAAIILVLIFVTIYAVVQQSDRNDADFPQVQIAEDAASALDNGAKPSSLISGKVDPSRSLATFLIIYNKEGQVVASSGYLNNKPPIVPYGVLTDSNNKIYHRVTWQPEDGVSIAAVAVSANNFYVLSGRSLKLVEQNIQHTFLIAFIGGLLSFLVLLTSFLLYKPNQKS